MLKKGEYEKYTTWCSHLRERTQQGRSRLQTLLLGVRPFSAGSGWQEDVGDVDIVSSAVTVVLNVWARRWMSRQKRTWNLKKKQKHVAVSTFKSPKIRKRNMTKWIYFCTTGWPVLAGCSRWRRGDRGWRRPRQSLWFITSISDAIVFLPHAERSFWQHTFETLKNLPATDKLFKVTLVCRDSVSFLCSAHFRGTSSPSSLKSTQRTGAWLRPRPPKNVYCSF